MNYSRTIACVDENSMNLVRSSTLRRGLNEHIQLVTSIDAMSDLNVYEFQNDTSTYYLEKEKTK